jgi:Ca2+-binding RTX toxin-like protein
MALFLGTDGNDNLLGSYGPDYMYSALGDDFLWGDNGSDTLRGSSDDDHLHGGIDSDVLDGGAGNDILIGGEDGARDILRGLGGRDWLDAGAGADTLSGGAGADLLIGGDGADLFYYNAVTDSTQTKSDVILDFSAEQGDRIDLSDVRTGTGRDFVFIGQTAFTDLGQVGIMYTADGHTLVNVNTSWAAGSELVIKLQGWLILTADNFVLSGGNQFSRASDNVFVGTDIDEVYFGEGGDDYIFGGLGNDDLHGGAGVDIVRGSDGNDIIAGDSGDDYLYGGIGRDRFVFDGNFDRDIVQDFRRGIDVLQFGPDAAGNHRTMESLTITQSDDAALIDAGDGNEILLAGRSADSLSARDFIFV